MHERIRDLYISNTDTGYKICLKHHSEPFFDIEGLLIDFCSRMRRPDMTATFGAWTNEGLINNKERYK